jgi:hypothetical protein
MGNVRQHRDLQASDDAEGVVRHQEAGVRVVLDRLEGVPIAGGKRRLDAFALPAERVIGQQGDNMDEVVRRGIAEGHGGVFQNADKFILNHRISLNMQIFIVKRIRTTPNTA